MKHNKVVEEEEEQQQRRRIRQKIDGPRLELEAPNESVESVQQDF